MELHKAFLRASKFCGRAKKDVPEVFRQIRFYPDAVYGTDGECGCIVKVDQPLPDNITVAHKDLTKIKNRITSAACEESYEHGGKVLTLTTSQGSYKLPTQDSIAHPAAPEIPESFDPFDWYNIKRVMHAVSKTGRRDLACLHFLPERVEATDLSRIAIVDVATGLKGVKVPADVFKYAPRGAAQFAISGDYAWFKWDDEMRFVKVQQGTYASGANFRERIPLSPSDVWGVTSTEAIEAAIKTATSADPRGIVVLELKADTITVKNASNTFTTSLPMTNEGGEPSEFALNGKFLEDAFKIVTTPKVRLCYDDPSVFRLESGLFVEAICPVNL